MKRQYIVVGAVCAVAVLMPLGRWALSSWQDAADIRAARLIESQFLSRRAASDTRGASAQAANPGFSSQRGAGASGRWSGGQSGQPGQPGQWGPAAWKRWLRRSA
jgi:hypothetical protein